MKLYYISGSCALSCHIVLNWIGKPYEAISVQYGDPELLKVNPLGMVPALIDHDLPPMSQNSAILKYLSEKYPEKKLGADDITESYQINYWSAFLTGDLHPAYYPFYAPNRYIDREEIDPQLIKEIKSAAKKRIHKFLSFINQHLENKIWMIGDRRTIIDAYTFAIIRWSMPLNDFNHLKKYASFMLEDEGVQNAMKEQELL